MLAFYHLKLKNENFLFPNKKKRTETLARHEWLIVKTFATYLVAM